MIYNLSITERAEKQLDELVNYLLFKLMNKHAAVQRVWVTPSGGVTLRVLKTKRTLR